MNDDDILNWEYDGSDILDWGDSPVKESVDKVNKLFDTERLYMPTDIEHMIKEVARLKKAGRDPTTTEFKPLRQNEPASADFEYHLGFYYKNPRDFNCLLLLQLPLAHMRAGAYHIETPIGLGFVTKANRDGSLLELQIVKQGGIASYYNYDTKTSALTATT